MIRMVEGRLKMNLRVQKLLELDKIINRVSEFAVCEKTAGKILRMKPSADVSVCERWLDETDHAAGYILRWGKPPIRPIRDISGPLHIAAAGGIIYNRELLDIKDVLHISRCIKEHLSKNIDREVKDPQGIVEVLILSLYTNKRLEEKISSIIISDEEIADDASLKLHSIRRSIIREQEAVKNKLNLMIRSPAYARMLQDPIITMRKDRYVIPVKAEYRNDIKGLIHDSSASGQTFFIEPLAVLESNNKVKALMQEEEAEIERILMELSGEAAEVSPEITSAAEGIFKLDMMFAKAGYALDINAIRPEINTKGIISVKKGRHPLIPKGSVVPVDFELGRGYGIVVITGPNTGGKTVTLKTIGLFVLMTQSGLFIPAADGSEISIFKEVFADIGDEQSIEQSLSTFSSHMKNIVHILNRARPSHLVLFDELGAGTDPVEGAALAVAILEKMRRKRITSIATTHYSELKLYALNTKGVINASCEFDLDTLMPTYRLLIGIPGKSNAFEISKRLGLEQSIIDDARGSISEKDMDFENTISQLQKYKKELENEMSLAEKYKNEAEFLKSSYEKTKAEIEKKRQKLLDEARREAYEMIEAAKTGINEILDKAVSISGTKDKIEIKGNLNELLRSHSQWHKHDDRNDEGISGVIFDGVFKQGDIVFVKKLNTNATVQADEDENGEVTVLVGQMKLKLKTADIRFIDKSGMMVQNKTGRDFESKTIDISTQIDLRGENVEDSIARLDKYLDDAHLANLSQITVIHGKGTGVLRSAIQEYIKRHHHVLSFRSGLFGEGESGVTVVTLK